MKLLRIYLNDHRAGAAGGVALARRIARGHQDSPEAEPLEVIAREIAEDRRLLERFARAHCVRANPVKQVVAVALERVSSCKLNGTFLRRSPLSDVLELEALLAGIDAKRSLWHALRAVELRAGRTPARNDDVAAWPDFDWLIERATRQRDVLMSHHHAAAREAFGPNPDLPTSADGDGAGRDVRV